jgi:nucleotide-binding universal stress UspA family protein
MMSIKRILCPVDFSEFSRQALARAVAIAHAQRGVVNVLHVVPLPTPIFVPNLDVDVPAAPTLGPGERDRLLLALDAFSASAAVATVAMETDVVEAPTVHGEILAQAGRLDVDLIVMGTHGRSGFQRLVLGSVAAKVLRTALPPVMTVGLPEGASHEAPSSFTRILCGIDFSECSVAALKYAVALAEGTAARITALNVVEWLPSGYDPLGGPSIDLTSYSAALERAGRERLHSVVTTCTREGVTIEEVVTTGKAHHEMLRLAAEQGTELIVLGIHGRTMIDRMLFGSTAEPVVRRATCPVLTVRPETAARVAAA